LFSQQLHRPSQLFYAELRALLCLSEPFHRPFKPLYAHFRASLRLG
jgi:hypothetical protein